MLSDIEQQYGEAMDEAVAKGVERLDLASDTWFMWVDTDILLMEDIDQCLLSQAVGGYKEGLDFLGIDLGEEYGFDIPDTIFDIEAQYEAYEMLSSRWESVIVGKLLAS